MATGDDLNRLNDSTLVENTKGSITATTLHALIAAIISAIVAISVGQGVGVPHAANQAALKALAVSNTVARLDGFAAVGDAPGVDYYLVQGTPDLGNGAGDGGFEIPSLSPGYYWHMAPQAAYSPKWWGAKADVVQGSGVVNTAAGSQSIYIPGGTFTSKDVGKLFTLTDITSLSTGNNPTTPGATGSGATLQTSIQSVIDGQHITVATAPNFTTTISQFYNYGTDDSAALNAFEAVMASFRSSASDFVPANFGGLAYGAASPIGFQGGAVSTFGTIVALSSTNFTYDKGLCEIRTFNASAEDFTCDSGWLPVNSMVETVNGITEFTQFHTYHWLGSFPVPYGATATASSGSMVVKVTDASNLASMMVSRGNAGIPDRAIITFVENDTTDTFSPCPLAKCVVLSKATTAALSSQAVTFVRDSNGSVCFGSTSGCHFLDSGSTQWSDRGHQNPFDHYGCAYLLQGNQTTLNRVISNQGAATLCLDGTANGNALFDVHAFHNATTDTDPPAMIIAAGAKSSEWHAGAEQGAVLIHLAGNNSGSKNPEFIIAAVRMNDTTLGTGEARIQVLAGSLGVNSGLIQVTPHQDMNSTTPVLSLGGLAGFTCADSGGTQGANYSYGLPCAQVAKLASIKQGLMMPAGNTLAVPNLDLFGGNLLRAGRPLLVLTSSTTFPYNLTTDQCRAVIRLNTGATLGNLVLPNGAGYGCDFVIRMPAGAANTGTITAQPATGATITDPTGSTATAAAAPPITAKVSKLCGVEDIDGSNNSTYVCR